MKLILKVQISDVDFCDLFKGATYGLPSGLALLDLYRASVPGASLDDIKVNDWAMGHSGKPMPGFSDHRVRANDEWVIELTETLARTSGQFDDKCAVLVKMYKKQFKQAVSIHIGTQGVTPVVSRDILYEIWAESGFVCEDIVV